MSYSREWDDGDYVFAFLWLLSCLLMMFIFAIIPYSIRASTAEGEFQKAQSCIEIPGRVWDHKTGGKSKRDVYRHVLKCKSGYIEELR